MEIEDIERKIEETRKRKDKAREGLIEMQRINKLPFHLQIQTKGQERTLHQVHDTQLWTMEKMCEKLKVHKDDWKDEFALFWIGFLKGEYKSINDYLKQTGGQNEN